MTNYEKMRRNMLDCQIRTAGVTNEGILNAFESVPRERYVPERQQMISYKDEDVNIGNNRYLLEPMVHAKLLQALDPQPHHVVLDIGGGTGYSASILSLLTSTVIALIERDLFFEYAQNLWTELGHCNIVGVPGTLKSGNPDNAPYDLIFINGAVADIPQNILNQLSVNGRLACVLKKTDSVMGKAVIMHRLGDHHYSTYELFDAGTPYLHGFEPVPVFQF